MEASNDIHYEKGDLSSEKNKRRFKTPAQVQALEKFYNEHKYPSESMKSEFAERIGLSEKQVSGWFCHRRSKDKKIMQDEVYTNRNQEFSNGGNAIHESISGLRQESCSSTKQVDRHFDGKEVESTTFHDQTISPAIPEVRGQLSHVECYDSTDEKSSGCSTTSYERFLRHNVDNCTMKPRHQFEEENYRLTDIKGARERGFKMSTKSAYIESPAVALVKLKLGGQYRENGPPLAADFDPLPPGAFDLPIRASNSGPLYVGDPIQSKSCSIQPFVGEHKIYDKQRRKWIPGSPCPEGSRFNRKLLKSNYGDKFTGCPLNPKASDIKSKDRLPYRKYIMDEESEDFAGESDDHRRNNRRLYNYGFAGESDNSSTRSFHLNGLKANVKKPLPYPPHGYKYNAAISQRELFGVEASEPIVKRKNNEFLNAAGRMQGRGMLKVLKTKNHKESICRENPNSVCPEMFMASDTQITRKMHGKDLMKNSEFYVDDLS